MNTLIEKFILNISPKQKRDFLRKLENLPADINFDQISEAIQNYTIDSSLQTEIKANRAKEVIRIIECGLWLLPKFEGEIYRGMIFDNEGFNRFVHKIQSEKILKTNSITSFTSNVKTAQIFATPSQWFPDFSYSVFLKILKNISGVDVQDFHEKYKSYQEILVSREVMYKVVSINKMEKNCEILLEEI